MENLNSENDDWTISYFMKRIWETYPDHPQVCHPGWWKTISSRVVMEMKDETDEDHAQLNNFVEAIGKVTKGWWNNYRKWAVGQFSDLYDKSSRLVGATYRKSFPTEMMMIVESYWNSSVASAEYTEEDFLSSLTIRPTSISSMIVPGQIEAAGATGVKRSAQDAFKDLLEKIGSSPSSQTTTGTMCSYISSSTSGEYPPPKFGLTEKYRDYRLQVIKKCK